MKLNRLRADLQKVHAEMHELSRLTRRVESRRFYLQVHSRKEFGQLTLRWRTNGGHIAWPDVPAFIGQELPKMQGWYSMVHQRVLTLNAREKNLRHEIRMLELLAENAVPV